MAHLEIPKSQLNNTHHNRIRQIMVALGWHFSRVKINGKDKRSWLPGA